jgi:hypothetical protein
MAWGGSLLLRCAALPPRGPPPQRDETVATLVGHSGRVNCVKWLPSEGEA